jgi:hypothetical protein
MATIPMQRLTTMKAATTYGMIFQPAKGWLVVDEKKEVALDVTVLNSTVAAGSTLSSLVIETAPALEGPWTAVGTFTAAATQTRLFLTSREGGTVQFQRLLRWKIDPSSASGDWAQTFRICATLK